ncbi:MAG: 16S rRNA (cytosine(1402)-N(4))-methyltransferase RsmH, partial [Rhodospirillaceae bacterium]|nr:16S rRNA (cytosine(1402)-N(4))-methyltransferase RsmH [Rhodospirillaceae bacterium]
MTAAHIPVLLNEVIRTLAPRSGGAYVDGTFGAGGYTEAILGAADCRVAAIDCDPDAIERGRALRDRYRGRLTLIEGRFGDMERLVRAVTDGPVDGVALDIGVSSPQLDTPERGFSFRHDGPLDMRMSRSGPTAADVVNRAAEADLSRIIFTLGEERAARRIARAIVNARRSAAIERTLQLAEIVRSVLPAAAGGIDPATRTFQALRLHVNGELEELDRGLRGAERLLRPGGRLAVVCFHSLEDRRVKRFLRDRSAEAPRGSRHRPEPGRR